MGGFTVRRRKKRRSLRRTPADVLKRTERTLWTLSALGCALALGAGLLRGKGALCAAGAALCVAVVASPAGLWAVCALLLRRMGQRGNWHAVVPHMQRVARVRTLCLRDLSELEDGRFEVETAGAPFAMEDERALRRQGAWMLLCTACALCSGGPHGQYARLYGYDGDKLRRQFPERSLHADEAGVSEGCFRDGPGERAFCSGPLEILAERCALLWEEMPRPMTPQEREGLYAVAQDALRRGLLVEAYAMRSGEEWAFLGYVALAPALRPGAAEQVQALRLRGVRTVLADTGDAGARLLARKAGVPCVRGRAVQGAEDLGGEDALFAREGGLSGVLEAVETARGRLARLVEAARSAAAAALLMNAVCTVSSIAGGAAWPFVPVAAAIYACIYLYYARQTR